MVMGTMWRLMVAAIKMLYVDVRACDDVDVDAFQYVNMVAAPHLNYDLVMQETDYPVHVAAYQLDLKYQIQNKNIIKKNPILHEKQNTNSFGKDFPLKMDLDLVVQLVVLLMD